MNRNGTARKKYRETLHREARDFCHYLGNVQFRGTERKGDVRKPPLLIIGGFLSDFIGKYIYNGHVEYFRELGYNAAVSLVPVSRRGFEEGVWLIEEEIRELFPRGREIVLVTHSYGGALGSGIPILTPTGGRISKIITLGTPFRGTPFLPLGWLVKRMTGASETLLYRYWKEFVGVSHRITSVSSPFDGIAPPRSCSVPRSRIANVNVYDHYPQEEVSHTGFAFSENVRELVGKILADDVLALKKPA